MTDKEQKTAAKEFAAYWKDRGYEKGESQPFWLELLGSMLGFENPAHFISFEDKVTYVNEAYIKDCMMERNRYMVDNSDYVVAVWNGKPSGTGKTVKYALEIKKIIYCIDITTFKICEI